MKTINFIFEKKRVILAVVLLLSLVGTFMWFHMPRQEDPQMPEFWGLIVSAYPGADAPTIERLILEPIEDELAEVPEIKEVRATAFDEMAVLNLELKGDTENPDDVWDDVREALEKAYRDFPENAFKPTLDDKMQAQESIVLAITNSADVITLQKAAKKIKHELLKIAMVKEVNIIADPSEQVTIELDDSMAKRLGITPNMLAMQLATRNRILPGGSLKIDAKSVRLKPLSEFSDVDEIKNTSILLPSGKSFPLKSVSRVHRGPAEPEKSKMRYNGEMSIGLGIVPVEGIHIVKFGEAVREKVAAIQGMIAPLAVHELTYQPKRTEKRIGDLSRSLLLGVLIVAGILILFMGFRLGLIVAAVVPLVTMTSLLLFAWGGGVLHQISIAALVLSLGMLVDNAIVMTESIQYHLDKGYDPKAAAATSVRSLFIPLAAATLTTLAAFIPMLIAKGPTAIFTRSIPVMIILTLSVSYFFAIFVTPVIGIFFLVKKNSKRNNVAQIAGKRVAEFSTRNPVTVIIIAVSLVSISFLSSSMIRQQFFPTSDRNQFVIDLKLTEGAHIDATDKTSREIEEELLKHPNVTKVSSFIGRSAPQFYYNIISVPFSPHFAQMIVETRGKKDIDPILASLRTYVRKHLPETELVARKLEQGPPVTAPIEIRLSGNDFDRMNETALTFVHLLKNIPGTEDIRHDLGPGAPTILFHINDAEAGVYGITRADVAQAIYGHTRGIPVGELYTDDDPVPILIRSSEGERMSAQDLSSLYVPARDGKMIPLSEVAIFETVFRPAAIKHRNASRIVTISSQLSAGYTFSSILDQIKKEIPQMEIPSGIAVSFGGEAEGSGEANTSIMKGVPMGMLVLIIVLLGEFNSFRRLFIILTTIPLAAAGVVPGLIFANQPFGFMSLLGVIALVGIVVNNAIVLLDVVEERRNNGGSIEEALIEAVSRRTRPIILTMGTTICGLIPLALSGSTLWPPLAWAMISGLFASTLLTLLVVPALYRILFYERGQRMFTLFKKPVHICMIFFWCMLSVSLADAEPRYATLKEAMLQATQRPSAVSSEYDVKASQKAREAETRAAFLPVLSTGLAYAVRDRDVDTIIDVPGIGTFYSSIGDKKHTSANVVLIQPIFDPSRQLYNIPAAKDEETVARLLSKRKKQEFSANAATAYLNVLSIDAGIDATGSYVKSLQSKLKEIQAMVTEGRALTSDLLKIRLYYEQAANELSELKRLRTISLEDLSRATGCSESFLPLPVKDLSEKPYPVFEDIYHTAMKNRGDIQALKMSIEAIKKRRAAVKAEALPNVNAMGKWIWDDGLSSYSEDNWLEVSVNVNWIPFASGTRFSKISAMTAKMEALKNDLVEIDRGVSLDIRSKISAIKNATDTLKVEKRGVEHATETLRVEHARYKEGRTTTNDLLTAEANLREKRTKADIARIEIVRGWIDIWLSTGKDEFNF